MTARNTITTDQQATKTIENLDCKTDFSKKIKSICLATAQQVSFVGNQTYPRPNHPNPSKRLSHLFTFCGVIISLRCTLETETKVTNDLLKFTSGKTENLLKMSVEDIKNIIKPSGLADKKAQWIFDGLKILVDLEKKFEKINDQDLRKELLKIKGMGNKAVDCYMLLGLERPVFPVDINVLNLTANIFPEIFAGQTPSFNNKKHTELVKKFYETEFPKNAQLYQIMHTYLLLANKHKIESEEL